MGVTCYKGHVMRIVGATVSGKRRFVYYYCNGLTCHQKKEVVLYDRSGKKILEKQIDKFPPCVEQREIDFL